MTMNWKERQDWLKEKYPLTVIIDRHNGTYSGAKFLAFPLGFDEVPIDVDGSDTMCARFWKYVDAPIGKGASAQEAIDDLIVQVKGDDQQTLDDLRNTIRYAASGNGVHISEDLEQRYAAWLNMVKELLDNKQKQGAWSKKEEDIIGYIRHILNDHAFEHNGLDVNGDYCTDEYAQADDFLRFLHPQLFWQRAHAGTQFRSEALVIADDGEPRLSKVAVNDCRYILVKKLLPKED